MLVQFALVVNNLKHSTILFSSFLFVTSVTCMKPIVYQFALVTEKARAGENAVCVCVHECVCVCV